MFFAHAVNGRFQPTLPARGATRLAACRVSGSTISTHAPRTGSDTTNCIVEISTTHFNPRSPHGERRRHRMELLRLHDDFNPRSPHGERHQRPHQPPEDGDFNPRSPHGERPSSLRVPEFIISFQPTLPARGATVDAAAVQPARPDFNPRSPHGERRCPPSGRAPVLIYFNPRSPHGERLPQPRATSMTA